MLKNFFQKKQKLIKFSFIINCEKKFIIINSLITLNYVIALFSQSIYLKVSDTESSMIIFVVVVLIRNVKFLMTHVYTL